MDTARESTMNPIPSFRRQRGMASLLISLVLLVGITIVVLVTAHTTAREQRLSANDMRAKAAFEAAQAGIDFGLSYFNSPDGMDQDNDGTVDTLTASAVDLNAPDGTVVGSYQVAFCDVATDPDTLDCGSVNACTSPADLDEALIFSCGWSDDDTAVQRIIQTVERRPAISDPPTNPLSSRGGVDVGGSATVTNYFNNLTIWTGQSLSNIGNSGKTFIRDPAISTPSLTTAPPDPPTTCSNDGTYICTTDKNTTGPDVIANDTAISQLTTDEYFENYFGDEPDVYQEYRSTIEVDDNDASLPDVSDLGGETNEIIWIEGDADFASNTTLGTRDDPVILIVDGNTSSSGTVTVNGFMYVLGDMSGSGNFQVNGSMIVDGTVGGTGSVDVVFDPEAVANAGNITPPASMSGSWRDW